MNGLHYILVGEQRKQMAQVISEIIQEKVVYKMIITVPMYPCSEGTDTGSPALGYRESGTGIPHFVTCEFTRLLPDPSRILHAWICNSSDPLG